MEADLGPFMFTILVRGRDPHMDPRIETISWWRLPHGEVVAVRLLRSGLLFFGRPGSDLILESCKTVFVFWQRRSRHLIVRMAYISLSLRT